LRLVQNSAPSPLRLPKSTGKRPKSKIELGGKRMHSLLSMLFGAALVGLVYGLSFLPSTSLAQSDETEEAATQEKAKDDTADAQSACTAGLAEKLHLVGLLGNYHPDC
jgi:hypothetical protein